MISWLMQEFRNSDRVGRPSHRFWIVGLEPGGNLEVVDDDENEEPRGPYGNTDEYPSHANPGGVMKA